MGWKNEPHIANKDWYSEKARTEKIDCESKIVINIFFLLFLFVRGHYNYSY